MNLVKKMFGIKYWFLNAENLEELEKLRNSDKAQKEISLFNIFSFAGNFLPIIISLILFVTFSPQSITGDENFVESIIEFLNKGSIPLICYSLIISGIIFLLDKSKPGHTYLRKKVLGIAILLMFFNASMYTLLSSVKLPIEFNGHLILFLLSIFLLFNVIEFAKIMILLQGKVVSYIVDFAGVRSKVRRKNKKNSEGIEFD